jgi:N-acetylneuraminic acid mutarotase
LVQLYDIPTNTWRNSSKAPFKVNHPNAAVVNGKLYLLGGLVDGPLIPGEMINWVASAECHAYDHVAGTWTKLESMPPGTERGSANIAVFGDMIYLAGGMTVLQVSYQDAVTTVTAFNTTSGKWQRLPPAAANIPEGRQHGVGAIVGRQFYVIGGRWFGQMNTRDTVYKLDLNNMQAGWKGSPSHMPIPRGGLSGGVVDGTVYTFGGEGNPSTPEGLFHDSAKFDSKTQKWAKLRDMSVPRHGTQAVGVGKKVYIPGGGLQQDGKPVVTNGVVSFQQPSGYFDAYCV